MRVFDSSDDAYIFVADNLYYVDIAVNSVPATVRPFPGDTVLYFESHDNKFYVILCDGMGSGNEASFESKMTAELLKEFIKSGIQANTAVNMINSSMALKTQSEVFRQPIYWK